MSARMLLVCLVALCHTTQSSGQETVRSPLREVTEAIAADNYEEARSQLGKLSSSTAAQVTPVEVGEMRRKIGLLERGYKSITRFRVTLSENPEDPAANQAVGEFYAFLKEDWERALPHLAKANDELLRQAAEAELTKPADHDAFLAVGDQWAKVADESRDNDVSGKATLRARHWYLEAAGASTESRQVVEERLDQLRFFPEMAIIFNSHNGKDNDRGTLLAKVSLLLKGEIVYSQTVKMRWQPSVSVPNTIRFRRIQADAIQVDVLQWHKSSGALAEIEVYQSGVNLAREGTAEASSEYGPHFEAERVNDGDHGHIQALVGSWVLPDNTPGSIRINFNRLQP